MWWDFNSGPSETGWQPVRERSPITGRPIKDQVNLVPTSLVGKRFSMQLQKTSSRPTFITTSDNLLQTSKTCLQPLPEGRGGGQLLWSVLSVHLVHLEWGMFCLSSLEMLIPALTASPINWMSQICNEYLYSSHTLICISGFSMEVSSTTVGFDNCQNLKQFFLKNA